ncbi:MAG TPA: 4-hydroxy-tetrahydrodipicolinate reductase [Fimbriimonadaceae bacterium]|nr:4-hydroxy-tetrahydrodipicolinate reductase [Fimbriimonadaceae bacterium]HRJ96272.1 4-hydroxy-tetrahydrodipicolinate reductase [Fimbriimonadaceae bacterium]
MGKPTGIIRVCLVGAAGKMGQETARALGQATGIEVVSAVDRAHPGESLRAIAGPRAPDLVIQDKVGAALDADEANVLVDFTQPGAAANHAESALKRGVAPVIGTSGLSAQDLRDIAQVCAEFDTPAMVVPNFAIGGVLMMRFAQQAAKWLPDVEVVEMHHDQKVDAPSGTATRTAELIAGARQGQPKRGEELIKAEGVRGGTIAGVPVHSVRLKGLVAHQMVMFGGLGETLTIRHDSLDRTSFMPGVILAVREVWSRTGLTIGLDELLV